ncbi:MAG: Gldg family protein [Lachnospiraceae bacterium]|nr:Gldg family protein [Lachnospiraceae bacterium]
MEKKNDKKSMSFFNKIGASFQRKGFRSGLYAAVTSVLVIVAVVIANLIVSAIGVQKDLTSTGEKSLTEETKELLAGLDTDVTCYYLTKDGSSTGLESYYEMYIDLYEDASDKITFETVDLLLNPKFAEQYTDKTVVQCSLIVVNEATKLSKYISVQDMVLTELTMDSETFQYKEVPVGLDIEGQINGAIRYVVSGQQTKLYAVSGHGEKEMESEATNLLGKANITYNAFESMTAAQVPDDCDILFVTVPNKDYSDAELEMFKAYADRGGDFLILAEKQANVPNYDRLLAYCGVQAENRVILEGDSSRHNPASQAELYPFIDTTHDITKNLSGANYLPLIYAYSLTLVKDTEHEITASRLLYTSEAAYAKNVENGKISSTKTNDDPVGPFTVGMYLKNTETKSEAVVISGGYVFSNNYTTLSNYANASLLTGSVNYLAGMDNMSNIRTLSFETEEMLTINAAQANTIAIVLVIAVPVALILCGIYVMLRRKNR